MTEIKKIIPYILIDMIKKQLNSIDVVKKQVNTIDDVKKQVKLIANRCKTKLDQSNYK